MATFPEVKEGGWGLSPLIWFLSFEFGFQDFSWSGGGELRSGEERGKKGGPKDLFASFA